LAWLAFVADWMGKVAILRWDVFAVEVALIVMIFGGQVDVLTKTLKAMRELRRKG